MLKIYKNPWLIQLAMGAERKVCSWMKAFPIVLDGKHNIFNLNMLPLGSYDVAIRIAMSYD